jgi:hypothetical protein
MTEHGEAASGDGHCRPGWGGGHRARWSGAAHGSAAVGGHGRGVWVVETKLKRGGLRVGARVDRV